MNTQKFSKINYKNKKVIYFSAAIFFLITVTAVITLFRLELTKTTNHSAYSDFFDVIGFSVNSNPYQGPNGSSYPIIAHLLLYPFSIIMNYSGSTNLLVNSEEWYQIIRGQSTSINGIIAITVYYLTNFSLLLYLCNNLLRKKIENKYFRIIFLLSLLLTGATINYLSRGNIVLSVLVLLLFFLNYYTSKNKYLKFLALFCLSLAIAIKIYPIVFTVILFREKKYKYLLITVILAIALFIMPFLFVPLEQFELFIKKFSQSAFQNNSSKLVITTEVSLKNLFALINNFTQNNIENILLIVFYICFFTILIGSTFSAIFIKQKWKLFVLIITLCNLIPNISFRYVLILYIIAIIEFIKEEEKEKFDPLFLLLFILIFNPIQFGSTIENRILGYKLHCFLIIVSSLCFNISFIVRGIKDFLETKKF